MKLKTNAKKEENFDRHYYLSGRKLLKGVIGFMGNVSILSWKVPNSILVILFFSFFLNFQVEAKGTINPKDALGYIGTQQTVCGTVANSKYVSASKGQPTFINLDQPYPNHIFTILIWGDSRRNFAFEPENFYRGRICVKGIISSYKGRAEIIVTSPDQITNE